MFRGEEDWERDELYKVDQGSFETLESSSCVN